MYKLNLLQKFTLCHNWHIYKIQPEQKHFLFTFNMYIENNCFSILQYSRKQKHWKKIQDKLIIVKLIIVSFIRNSFVRIIQIEQILFDCSLQRELAVHCLKLYTRKKKCYQTIKKNTYHAMNVSFKICKITNFPLKNAMSKRPLDLALPYSEDILLQCLRNILT